MNNLIHARVNSSSPARASVASPPKSLLQCQCVCDGLAGREGECEECQRAREGNLQRKSAQEFGLGFGHDFGSVNVRAPSRLAVTQAGDSYEQEADRLADAVMSGRSVHPLQSAAGPALQREDSPPQTGPATEKPKSEEEKYKEAALKLSEALRATDAGKKLEAQVTQLGKDFVATPEGKAVAGTALAGALAAIIATNKELPVPIPEIPLDWLAPGMKAKLTWEGPVRTPTNVGLTVTTVSGVSIGASYSDTPASPGKPAEQKAGLTVTIPLGGSAKKSSGPSDSEKIQAETAKLTAERTKIQESLKTPEQRAEDKKFWDNYWRSKNDDPLNPFAQPDLGLKPLKRKKTDDNLLLMRKAVNESTPLTAPPIVDDVLAESGGPLDAATRGFMESRFGHDFSRVRVHTDARAAESARAVHASAYTVGNHLVFAAGTYQPSTSAGQRLLAHELVHTIQQGATQRAGSDKAVSSATKPQLQRYPVPASLACNEVVDWLNSNSPYAPEWAETRCNYSFNGQANVATTTQPDGTVKADVRGNNKMSVSVSCPIDRPEWSPSNRPNQAAEVAAWRAMRATLDQHEAAHRSIGQTWRATLEGRYRAVNFSVTGADQAEAMANASAELTSRKDSWGADAQAAQDAIDPFRGAVLACPPAPNPTSP
jgi:hypothetical protein